MAAASSPAAQPVAPSPQVRNAPPAWRLWLGRVAGHALAKPLLQVLLLLPLAGWVWGGFNNGLGANPAETILRGTGLWTLRLLALTLCITPLRQWLQVPVFARWRRMLGVTTFGYGVLHFLSYAWLDMGLDPEAIARDLYKRPFALVGFLALLCMVPLAATSFNRAIKFMGAARWQKLHQLVWATAALGLLHFFWKLAAKSRVDEMLVYVLWFALLVAARLAWKRRTQRLSRLKAAHT